MQPGARSEVLCAGMCLAGAIASPADSVPAPGLLTLVPDLEKAPAL
jgi:hypothetical protein